MLDLIEIGESTYRHPSDSILFSPESVLDNVVNVITGASPVQAASGICNESAAGINVVTVSAAPTDSRGKKLGPYSTVTALVYFGSGRGLQGPVPIAVGNGLSFPVPGSAVRVMVKVSLSDNQPGSSPQPAVDPTTTLAVFVGIARGAFPKMSNGAPLMPPLAPSTIANLPIIHVGTAPPGSDICFLPVPMFATAFKLERKNFANPGSIYTINFLSNDTAAANVLYQRILNPGDVCDWIPLTQAVAGIQILGPAQDFVQPMFAIEI